MQKPKVAVVYHFFPHYRSAVIRAMLASERVDYTFFGHPKDPFTGGIKTFDAWPSGRYVPTPLKVLKGDPASLTKHGLEGGPIWQKGIVPLAFDPRYRAIIYLGDPNHISTWVSAFFARLMGKRVLFWTIGWLREESGLKSLIRVRFLRLSNRLMLYGQNAQSMAVRKGWPIRRTVIVANSLDLRELRAAKEQIAPETGAQLRQSWFGNDHPVVICVSRLTAKRRLDLLIDAAAVLAQEGKPVNVLLVGDGPEKDALADLASSKAVPIHLYGPAYGAEELARCYSACSVCVCPGMSGLTGIQSLAFEVPVVTHDDPWRQSPEYEAIIPPKMGQLFKENDLGELVTAMRPFVQSPEVAPDVRAACWEGIRETYDAVRQGELIDRIVLGEEP